MASRAADISKLVARFRAHVKAYKSRDTKEAEIRQQFIDPFWRALGWDVGDTKGVGPTESEVIIEKNVETVDAGGLRSRRPDYLFRLGGFARFIVEAKKPAIDIDDDKDAIFQAKQYAWNSTIHFAVLTDFERFRLFDTTLKPVFNEPRRGLVREFALDYDKYESQWDALTATFGREAVEGGSLGRLLTSIRKDRPGRRLRTVDRMLIDLKGGEPVDQVFLAYLDTHRRHFAAALYRDNKAAFREADTLHGAARLTEAVQRIMDRLVFMRVIEDRGIVPFGALRKMLERIGTEGGEFYTALCATFRDYDAKYNGYLYKPHFSEELSVDGAVLADFTRTLYPPDGPWDFAAIGDDILGTVYERFLGNTIVVKGKQATVEEKIEVRHAGGVYYTPRFVVDSIIRRVIGPKVAGKTPAEVLDVKILDPACGSGSFLVAALQYLFDYCLAAVNKDPALAKAHVPALSAGSGTKGRKKKSEIAFQDKEGRWYLAPDFRAALLTHCIHGVDIDQQAVEVTVMSLYLKMLESKLPENWATLWVERQLLPSLDNNIQCGNSLIDHEGYDAFASFHRRGLFGEDADTAFRINRFDWTSRTRGFGRLLDAQAVRERGRAGFDCIIGNPPYIRVQELNKWAPEECAFYKWKYKAAAKGNYDIYVVFTERALSLLAPDGLLGFIMPHKFWQAQYGAGLRKLIADGKHLKAVVDFAHHQVFQNATTYTAIHVLQRSANAGPIDYAAFTDLTDGVAQCAAIDKLPQREIEGVTRRQVAKLAAGGSAFSFGPPVAFDPDGEFKSLSAVADLAQGFKTGADKVFVVTLIKESKGIAKVRSEETERDYEIESAALRPLVKSEHMKAFDLLPSPLRLIFPYLSDDKAWRLATPDEMEERFPLLWKDYLPDMRTALDKREKGRFKGERFYQYSRPQNFAPLSKPKIINPDICEHPQMCWDASGRSVFSGGAAGGVAIVPTKQIDGMLLMGILNSKLADNWIRANGTPFRGGYLNCEIRFIRDLPIKLPTTPADKKLAERITGSVRAIMDAKAALRRPKLSDRETKQHEAAIEAHEDRINKAVFALYGVDGLPGA
ncbi:MAG: Eco57I restriction-modification methylase domain-containing protein [Phycisphaerales bacterium]|nr:Eco57I restriction-modification methylase domain-containing protein [Phycisphaerales bacterium]